MGSSDAHPPVDAQSEDTSTHDVLPLDADPFAPDAELDGPIFDANAAPAAWSEVYAIIALRCAGSRCHVPGVAGSLSMPNAEVAYDNLIAVRGRCGGITRVVPGSAERSLLYQKIADANPCGVRMPIGESRLTRTQIHAFETWINAGAFE